MRMGNAGPRPLHIRAFAALIGIMLSVSIATSGASAFALLGPAASTFHEKARSTGLSRSEATRLRSVDATELEAIAALQLLLLTGPAQGVDPGVLSAANADIAQQRHLLFVADLTIVLGGPRGHAVTTAEESTIQAHASTLPLQLTYLVLPAEIAADLAAVNAGVAELAAQAAAHAAALAAQAAADLARSAIAASTPRKTVQHSAAPAAGRVALNITVVVRTTVNTANGGNGQSEINAGGEVGVIWPGYGTIVSAHDTNDARALSLQPGDLVTFTGAIQGRYRVTGLINVPKGSAVSTVAALGTAMMMQTCIFNTKLMRIVGMVPA